jgi:polyhydroxybutyrate depolymerase
MNLLPINRTASFRHQGVLRSYNVHLPPQCPDKPPLVMVLHGGGGTAAWAAIQSGMNEVADANKFAVMYPSATFPGYWFAGTAPKAKWIKPADDVDFLQAAVEHLEKTVPLGHVFCCGISNGGHMTLKLAVEWDRIRAVACVAGIRKPGQYARRPNRPIPLLCLHGLQDNRWAPYNGGSSSDSFFEPFDIPHAGEATMLWAINARSPQTDSTLATGPHRRYDFTGGSPVTLYALEDGGHSWPGGKISKAEMDAGCGPVSTLDGSREIWRFFNDAR